MHCRPFRRPLVRPGQSTVLGLLLLPLLCGWASAQESDDGVPVRRIVLFTSGVGYFEHAGPIDGEDTVELRFNVEEVNDLLKSLVVQDPSGGEAPTVTYESRDPVARTLQTFAVDLTEDRTVFELLRQMRGERVEIEAVNTVTGRIVGVESRQRAADENGTVRYDLLNLLTEGGLRSFPLDEITGIRFQDEEVNAEFRKALEVLATANQTDRKTVQVRFTGEGERPVRIGYIREMPVWKTSYRLVLDEENGPFLQGWAIVENTTETDWENVALTLVSGRPVSFRMNLYQPLYADRPLVQPELYSSLTPRVHGQDVYGYGDAKAGRPAQGQQPRFEEEQAPVPESPAPAGGVGGMGGGGFGGGGMGGMDGRDGEAGTELSFNIRQTQSIAQSGEVGELFQYQIDRPVTLTRQKSAMLPIVNAGVAGEKVSIYNPVAAVEGQPGAGFFNVDSSAAPAKHPLNGFRLKNETDLHLMQGPITVFDGATYAGDARIEDIPPGSERLISYALDLETEVAVEEASHPEQITSSRISKGVLYISHKQRRSKTYTVKNSGDATKTVLIEQPVDDNWQLVEPEEPDEKTRNLYRFAVEAEPGEPQTLTVTEERTQREATQLTNLNDSTVQVYLSAEIISEEIKETLREVIRRKQAIAELRNRRTRLEGEIESISREQERIRQNMSAVGRGNDLYNRYVRKLTDQEDRIEELRAQIDEVQSQEAEKQRALEEYLMGLEIE